jgi:hypothetical protein
LKSPRANQKQAQKPKKQIAKKSEELDWNRVKEESRKITI